MLVCVLVCGCLCICAYAYACIFTSAYSCAYVFAYASASMETERQDRQTERETESKTELNLIPFRPVAIFRTSVINSSHSMRAVAPRQCVMIGKTNLWFQKEHAGNFTCVCMCVRMCEWVWVWAINCKDNIPDKLISSRLGTHNETESGQKKS